jgi:hypothetical protein
LVLFGNLEEVWNGFESESEVKINTNIKLNSIKNVLLSLFDSTLQSIKIMVRGQKSP